MNKFFIVILTVLFSVNSYASKITMISEGLPEVLQGSFVKGAKEISSSKDFASREECDNWLTPAKEALAAESYTVINSSCKEEGRIVLYYKATINFL